MADGKIEKSFWSLHLPRKTYREGENYYGTFPEGFEKKLKELGLLNGKVVHLCSGMSELGDVRVDIHPKARATLFEDARHTSLPNGCANFVMLDAYYSDEDYAKAGQTPVSIYEFLREAFRICKKGGQIGVLHNRPPRKPKGTKLTHLIAISVGPDRLLRCFQVFRKDC